MKLKNLSSVILAAMMAATSVPAASLIAPYNSLSAYAVETAEPEAEAPIASGLCGENLTWEVFAEEDSLVIDGTGAMTEWENAEDAPWAEYGDRISLIVIRENVESVSENAFGATSGRTFYFDGFDCVIPDSETFLPENASIHGYDGSTAQAYAEKYGREFTSEGEYEAPSDENISTDENAPTDEEDSTVIEGNRIVAEGICGENLKWEIDSLENILIISGYGEMTDWENPEDAPWFEYSDEFDIVIIRPGVGELSENSLGSNAKIIYLTSYNCVIPDSETAIPADARILGYAGSTAQAYAEKYGREFKTLSEENEEYPLMEGVCTENLEWILWDDGSLSFYGYGDIVAENGVYPWDVVADSIKEVVINTAVKSIGENAFTNCTNLESVMMYTPDCQIADSADVFPSGVLLQVGDGSTAEEYAVKYNLTHDVYNFFTASGEIGDNLTWVLFNGGSLRIYGEGDMIDLGGVSPWAEYEDEITRVQINHEVTSVDEAAFEGCDNIAEMIVLNPECKFAESEDAIPEDTVIYAAEGSSALMYAQLFGRSFKTLSSEITAPEEEEESYIAYGELGENLTWKLLDDGMLEINGEGVMNNWASADDVPWAEYRDQIKRIRAPKEVKNVGDYAFYGCVNLEYAFFPTIIGEHAYENCKNITNYYLYEEPIEIKDYAFYGCDKLNCVTIRNQLCVIADSPNVFPANTTISGFAGSTAQAHAEKYGLEFVDITETTVEMIADGELGDNLYWSVNDNGILNVIGSGDMIEIDGVYPWDEFADEITDIYVGDYVTSISAGAFDDCVNAQEATVFNSECVIADVDNVFPENIQIICYENSSVHEYAEKYGYECFFWFEPDASGTIGNNLYWDLDEGNLNIYGEGEMLECGEGDYPWSEYADEITSIAVNDYVTSISAGAFDDCVNASDVYVYNSECVIADVDNVFPANIQITCYENSKVHEYAEKYGYNCTFWYESDASGTIGNNLYWDLKEGHLNIYGNGDMIEIDGVYPWDEYAEQITYVTIQNDVTSISAGAFDDCANVEAVLIHNNDCVIADVDNVFPANTVIHGYAGSTAQAHAEKYNMKFEASLIKEIVSGEFGEGFEWTICDNGEITINGVGEMPEYEAGNYPWSDYSDMIKNISLAKELTSVGAYAFYNCTNLIDVVLEDCINIGEHAFEGCENLSYIFIWGNENTIEIGDYAFYGCDALENVFLRGDSFNIADSPNVFPEGVIIEGRCDGAKAYAEKYNIEYDDLSTKAEGNLTDTASWIIYNNNVLDIWGEGIIPDSDGYNPWSEYADDIKNIFINNEIVYIGDYAFYNCKNAETIVCYGVYSTEAHVIGNHAFDGCEKLKEFIAHYEFVEIGDYAFYNCDSMEDIFIYNPECVIADSEFVFPANTVIHGYAGSTAQAYAEKYGRDFEVIEGEPVTTTAPDSDSETTTTTTTTTTPNDSESELPQTGFSKAYDYLAFSAGVMALCGIYAMKKGKKKEDEE